MNLKEIDNNIHILNDFDSKIGEIKQLNDDFLTIELDLIISDIKYLDKVILFLMKRLKNKMYKNVIIKHKPVGNVKICSEFLNLLLQYDLINTDTNDSEIILNIRLNSNNLTNKNAKVIPLWFGPRRKWAKYTEDYKKEFLKMFEFILNKEINLDKGIDCDTIFYINNPFDENLRNELGIPSDSIVFGRYGGKSEFNIDITHKAIIEILESDDDYNNNVYFLFMNTDKFYEHSRIIYLDRNISKWHKYASLQILWFFHWRISNDPHKL